MSKVDYKKELKELYSCKQEPVLVNVPSLQYLSVEGKGDPNTSKEYQNAIEALFPVAFKIKFISKKELNKDYVVLPLEGMWWTEDMSKFSVDNKNDWLWNSLIMQPAHIDEEMLEKAKIEVTKKKELASLDKVKLISIEEGLSAQIMHIGPYSDEAPTIAKLHGFIEKQGYSFDGLRQKHHEIYLSDMRKTSPEKLRTIVRQPVG